jgi:putative Mg2+ transporter-C (MgtC) family protein
MIDAWQQIDAIQVAVRLTAATTIGGILGLDRELHSKPAGMRTHALVALGSALATVCTIEFVDGPSVDHAAITRTIQGIIAGVGFLGGGAILRAKDREEVTGLTTAASIWLVAALGIACGGGFWVSALVSMVLSLLVLVLGRPVEMFVHKRFGHKKELPARMPDE